jgi:hypothetical protein
LRDVDHNINDMDNGQQEFKIHLFDFQAILLQRTPVARLELGFTQLTPAMVELLCTAVAGNLNANLCALNLEYNEVG